MYTGNLLKFNRSTVARVGTTACEIFPDQPFDFQNLANKRLTVIHGLGDELPVFNLETSPDAVNWATLSVIGGGTMGTNEVHEVAYTLDSRKYWRLRAAVNGSVAPASYATVSAFWTFS